MSDAGQTSAIILAGGRSSRFGRPKLAAELDGRILLEHSIRAAAEVAGEILVTLPPDTVEPVLENGVSKTSVTVRFVRDPEEFGGPLVGLVGGLTAATNPFAIVVGGDMPRLQPAVLRMMLGHLAAPGTRGEPGSRAEIEVVVLGEGDGRRPLPMALAVAPALSSGAAALASGERSLRALLDRLAVRELAEAEWRAVDPDGQTLIDVDVPADLNRLKHL